jgi:hypothetical protein
MTSWMRHSLPVTVEGHHDLVAPVIHRTATAAPLWRRFAAWIMDGALALAPFSLLWLVPVHGLPHAALGLLGVAATIAVASWNSIALVARCGQSLGLRWLGMQLLDSAKMTPPGIGQIVWRGFLGGMGIAFAWHPFFLPRVALMINPWAIVCYAFAFTDQRWHRALYDRWAHTVVIDRRPDWRPLTGLRFTRPE